MAEVIVVHGYAGSGKTTQCERLVAESPNDATIQHISVGNKLRAIKNHTAPSKHSDYINSPAASSPLPHAIVNDIVFEAIEVADHDLVLIDGYPRYPEAVELFEDSLATEQHQLLGTAVLRITLATSLLRIHSRGLREGETMKGPDLLRHTLYRYNRDMAVTGQAIEKLGDTAPVLWVEADDNKDEVYARFKAALGQLALEGTLAPN